MLGIESGEERTVRQHMITLQSGEISGDELRYDATMLPEKEKFLAVLNPFDLGALFLFDARGGFVTALERIVSVCRGDVEAVKREQGRAAKMEAAILAPIRARHLEQARQKTAMHKNNAKVLAEAAGVKPSRFVESEVSEAATEAPEAQAGEESNDDLATQFANLT